MLHLLHLQYPRPHIWSSCGRLSSFFTFSNFKDPDSDGQTLGGGICVASCRQSFLLWQITNTQVSPTKCQCDNVALTSHNPIIAQMRHSERIHSPSNYSTFAHLKILFSPGEAWDLIWVDFGRDIFFQVISLSLTEEQHEEFRNISVVDYGAYVLVRQIPNIPHRFRNRFSVITLQLYLKMCENSFIQIEVRFLCVWFLPFKTGWSWCCHCFAVIDRNDWNTYGMLWK